MNIYELEKPAYILDERILRRNLSLIKGIAEETGVEIILAFKAFALWKTFPIFREYISGVAASSLSETRLAYEEFGVSPHTFSPAYTDYEIKDISRMSSHLIFNSLSQYSRHYKTAIESNPQLRLGIRINPEYSEVGTDIYNPCAPGTRFGVQSNQLPERLPDYISGFHCHCHCESGADVFQRTLAHIEDRFSQWFDQIEWINFGGGHLMTRKDYDISLLVSIIKGFRKRYPHLHIIMEPGSAFAWQTGFLLSHIVDIVENDGIKTAVLDVSFTCHMPDCLEMPYWPNVRGAKIIEGEYPSGENVYRLGGNSCLSGDWMQSWIFDHELQVGEVIVFEDMIHYTTVKTCTFNGIAHPDICMLDMNDKLHVLRKYGYEDYRDRMD